MLELLFEFFSDFFLQLLVQVLVEIGIHGLSHTFRKKPHPFWATIGYFLWGILLGGLSLYVMPKSFITDPYLKWLNLIFNPILIGFAMMLVGRIRQKKGQEVIRLDQFGYAFIFAFAFAMIRFACAK